MNSNEQCDDPLNDDSANNLNGFSMAGAPELTVVVPTFNESKNVSILVDRLRKAL